MKPQNDTLIIISGYIKYALQVIDNADELIEVDSAVEPLMSAYSLVEKLRSEVINEKAF